MTTGPDEFAARYAAAFRRYEEDPDERELSAAYELGRSAVREGLGVLELAAAHHQTLVDTLSSSPGRDVATVIRAGRDFFIESLSAFEMAQRVLQKARQDADLQRRQATLLRQLSTFLADASIALDAAGSLEEVLQLVAEHARETTGAGRCAARLSFDEDRDRAIVAVAEADPNQEASYPKDFDALYAALAPPAASVRMTGSQLANHPARRQLEDGGVGDIPIRGWLAASLTALDGRDLGLIQVFDKEGDFSELDEAVLVQLAQMASAAVERAQLYRR